MPEGPEIRLAADRIAAVLVGRELQQVELVPARLRAFSARLSGTRVLAVDTRGKAMLTRFDNGLTLYSHNQLYGRWYIERRGSLPLTARSLRVALHTADNSVLLYSASDIAVLDAAGLAAHAFLSRLGPDLLDPRLDWRTLSARLDERRFRGRRLANLYLDQGFVAGIGNYLRSEMLFFARVAPSARPRDLAAAQRDRLARVTLDIGRRAYRTRGVTNRPAQVRRLEAGGAGYESLRFAVFERDGLPCYACGAALRRVEAGSRRLYFCPLCQSAPAPGGVDPAQVRRRRS